MRVVSVLGFYAEDPSLNPAEVIKTVLLLQNCWQKNGLGLTHLKSIFFVHYTNFFNFISLKWREVLVRLYERQKRKNIKLQIFSFDHSIQKCVPKWWQSWTLLYVETVHVHVDVDVDDATTWIQKLFRFPLTQKLSTTVYLVMALSSVTRWIGYLFIIWQFSTIKIDTIEETGQTHVQN